MRKWPQATVCVSDNGVGIPQHMVSRVFDLFTQVDSARHRAQGGLGIGLTTVKQIAELHGGRVEAHSEGLGQGSRFVLTLPLSALAADGVAGDDADRSG